MARPRKRQQYDSSPSQLLVAIINHASRATNYCVGGDLPGDLSPGLEGWFAFYNHERLHQSLAYRIPTEVYHDLTPVSPRGRETPQTIT